MKREIEIPRNGRLRFNQSYGFESDEDDGTNYDGGVLEYSTDGGTTWKDAGPLITQNGYPGAVGASVGSALAGKPAEALLADGLASADPIVYEDFLPVSAAGIFQSNLGGGEQRAYAAHANRAAFEQALGAAVHDEFAIYADIERASLQALQN
jgi:hypothetical protein